MSPPRKTLKEKLGRFVVDGDCWIFTGPKDRDGYGVFGHGRGKQIRANRAAFEIAHGNIPPGMLVCHKCDRPSCINPAHLFLGTHKDNTRDMLAKGRGQDRFGENGPRAKLSTESVREIISKRALGLELKQIAALYGISFQHVSAIFHKRVWRNL